MNKKEILSLLEIKKILIIVGGDKTEKASEIPKLFLNDNPTNKTIVCTEAKRSNAIKLAELVSKQMNEQVGKTVGYGIRFEEKVSNESKIKFITDGLLVREMIVDPLLNNYSILIIDQVDERSLSTDLLLALLKKLEISTTKRPDLKIVILTSTNSNANEIKNFFGSDNVSTLSFGNEDSSITTTTTTPEIEKCKNLTPFILQLKSFNIDNLKSFEMITSPSLELINQSLNELFRLGAISSNQDNGSSKLTSIGNTMVGLPLEPIYSKVIIESEKLGCSEQILNIISMLLINNKNDLFINSKLSSSALIDSQSDHLTLLNVYNSFISNKCSPIWCNDNQINFQTIQTVQQIKNQLLNCLTKVSVKLLSCNDDGSSSKQSTDHIKKSFLSGFFNNVAKSTTDNSYETIVEPIRKVLLHPTSSVVPESNQFVLFGETFKIDRSEYIKDVSVIDQSWLR
ncbi:hypothetical protein DDB_G0268212 [Dictyostelium discoideum AX4]|uniref:Helicase ATP-binding domain-containing protein n=1 Tax=Dictyostelium discoideum TaxID=44689 RepID=Q55F84_DICDI|nr:hypothetical protein DDB_G0268212 [Dictyostelium discoideum AX4]EAL73559.1 hypothetical protein DDB_G0268212 [Dictyostelium discoideum AX4]|eukprot:XP_647649.1 hypothetical protein DDB_G0268212 [Dictyostelium discoideum AX4]